LRDLVRRCARPENNARVPRQELAAGVATTKTVTRVTPSKADEATLIALSALQTWADELNYLIRSERSGGRRRTGRKP
jgi:hypothetical protein